HRRPRRTRRARDDLPPFGGPFGIVRGRRAGGAPALDRQRQHQASAVQLQHDRDVDGEDEMSTTNATTAPVSHADRFFIGGEWVAPSSDATIDVIDSGSEELYYTIAEAAPDDMSRAVAAARRAFDAGPWSRLTHAERADYIRALGAGLQERNDVLGQLWPRESGALYKFAQFAGRIGSGALESYAALA